MRKAYAEGMHASGMHLLDNFNGLVGTSFGFLGTYSCLVNGILILLEYSFYLCGLVLHKVHLGMRSELLFIIWI
jgi:hypothetical protein